SSRVMMLTRSRRSTWRHGMRASLASGPPPLRRYPVRRAVGPVRTLCIAEKYPWPAIDGYKLRLSNVIGGLLGNGPVDFVCLDGGDLPRDPSPEGVTVIDAPEGPEAPASSWVPAWLRGGEPRRLVRRDF